MQYRAGNPDQTGIRRRQRDPTIDTAYASRISVVRRRPPDFAAGMNGAVSARSRSVKSLGYRKLSRLCSTRAISVHRIASSIFSTKTDESQEACIAQRLSDRARRLGNCLEEMDRFGFKTLKVK
jgi:hypothetical protein